MYAYKQYTTTAAAQQQLNIRGGGGGGSGLIPMKLKLGTEVMKSKVVSEAGELCWAWYVSGGYEYKYR